MNKYLALVAILTSFFLNTAFNEAVSQEEATPNKDEINRALTNTSESWTSARNGNAITMYFKPDGIIAIEVDTGSRKINQEGTWHIDDKNQVCTVLRRGTTCSKTVKVENNIFRILEGGTRRGPYPIK